MEIVEITSKNEWKEAEHSSFLQSWQWGEFQKSAGHEPMRVKFSGLQVSKLASVFLQGFIHRLPLGQSYLYLPHCPSISHEMMGELVKWVKKKGIMFLRVEPKDMMRYPHTVQTHSTKHRQHGCTLQLDLHKTEEELLLDMHSKTRYNIRLAKRKELRVEREKNVDVFWKLYAETTERDSFRGFPKKYYTQMLTLDMIKQVTIYHEDMPLASGIFVEHEGVYTYLHGASTHKKRKLMAPYLLQWSAIQYAKERGCKTYDFWGIAPPALKHSEETKSFHTYTWDKEHSLSGVTRFKAGFGGEVIEYPQATEIVVLPGWYRVYQWVQKLRRAKSK